MVTGACRPGADLTEPFPCADPCPDKRKRRPSRTRQASGASRQGAVIMVRRRFRPLIAFAAVIAAAGSVTAAGLTFTAHTVSKTVAELPEVKTRVLPSYVVRLPIAKAADLVVSKTLAVTPQHKMPVTVPVVA